MKTTYISKDNAILEMEHEGHKYVVSITYGKIEAYKDDKRMKRLGKVVQYMLNRFNSSF